MNRITKYIAISALGVVFLALPSVASAQWRDRDRDDDYYGGNARYHRNLRATIKNLKNRAKNFEKATNRAEDRRDDRDDRWGNRGRRGDRDRWGNRGPWGSRNGGWYGGGSFGRLEDLADSFRRATDRLDDAYGNGRDLRRSRDEARRVLDIGNQIENQLRGLRGDRNLERQWSRIRYDLNTISDVYGRGYYGNGRYPNRYPNRNGDWRDRLPFPFPF